MSPLSAGRKGSGQLEVMQKAGWKIDENEKGEPSEPGRQCQQTTESFLSLSLSPFCSLSACYIDIDDDDDDANEQLDESQRVYSRWCELPNVVLEEIFTYLTPRERYYASLVSDPLLLSIPLSLSQLLLIVPAGVPAMV